MDKRLDHPEGIRFEHRPEPGAEIAVTPGPMMPPLWRPRPNPIMLVLTFFLVTALLMVVVLVVILIVGSGSPAGVFREYVDAANDRDVKRMFDQTVLRFAPDYAARLQEIEQTVFMLDPVIKIKDVDVTYKDQMSEWQQTEAQDIIVEVEASLPIAVDDYCIVSYTIEITYMQSGDSGTFNSDVVCVMVDGSWYLAIPGYF